MKRFKLVLVAFAMLSFVAFYGCQTTTEGDLEDALNGLTEDLDGALEELETEEEVAEEEVAEEAEEEATE